MECINTYGCYNRTCKCDYVRPFQPCKNVNANLTKTYIPPLTAQVRRDTQETVMKRNFYHVNLYIDSTGRVSNCSNSNLKGQLGLLRSMLVQITLFFLYRVRSLHNTDVRSQLFSCRPTVILIPPAILLKFPRLALLNMSGMFIISFLEYHLKMKSMQLKIVKQF